MSDDLTEKTPKPELAPDAVEIYIEPPTVELGQVFSLNVVLKHPPHTRFELSTLPDHPSFDILSKTRKRQDNPADYTTTFSIQMAAFELGDLELPSFEFEITTPTQVGSFVLPSKTISVVTSREETSSQLEDVRPPAPVFVPSYTMLYWGAVVLAVALVGVVIWKWLHRRKKQPKKVAIKPLAARTKEALDALRAQTLPAQGKAREYYFMLSEIIRGYIGELYHFDALECTTTEFIQFIQQLHSAKLPREKLAQFSYESDFIKYAKGKVDIAKCELDLEFAYQLVDNTTPSDESSTADNHHVRPSFP